MNRVETKVGGPFGTHCILLLNELSWSFKKTDPLSTSVSCHDLRICLSSYLYELKHICIYNIIYIIYITKLGKINISGQFIKNKNYWGLIEH